MLNSCFLSRNAPGTHGWMRGPWQVAQGADRGADRGRWKISGLELTGILKEYEYGLINNGILKLRVQE